VVPDGPDHPGYRWEINLSEDDRQDATRVISEAGLPLTPSTVQRVGEAIWQAKLKFFRVMERRAEGDWSPDPNLPKFPPLTVVDNKQPQKGTDICLDFNTVLEGWARDHGWTLDAKPIPRPLYDRQRTLDRLADFLGRKDATKVTKADAVRWKEDMQARGLAVATVRNDLSEMSALWRHALRQGKLGGDAVNPFEGIAPPKPKVQKKQRRAFTDLEAAEILTAARDQKGYMRWLPWVCCLTGARLSEICQGFKEDVAEINGVPALRIHDEGADHEDGVRSVKNPDSRRTIPLHPALIAEGFLDYLDALPARSPLFPDAKPDAMFGLRATNAGKKMSRWLKEGLGITDKRISPNHSWRHWFTDACRKVSIHPEVRSASTGHSAKMDESAHYGDGMKSFLNVLAEAIATVRPPLPPKGALG
jgi:integrase